MKSRAGRIAKIRGQGQQTSSSPERSPFRQLRPGPGRRRDEVLAHQRSRLLGATIELVAERGYDNTTVGDIVRLAGVSKASFYQQFDGKDECFIAAYDRALRSAARAVLRGESSAEEGRNRLRGGLMALADLIVAQPKAAKLVLIEGPAATPAIRHYATRRFGLLKTLVRERGPTLGQEKLPDALIAGIVRGIEHQARRGVNAGCPDRLRDLVDPLLDWVVGFAGEEASATFRAPTRPSYPAGIPVEGRGEDTLASSPRGSRDLLTAATLRLASREGVAALTPSRIRRAAGVSRRSFDENFDSPTSCFLAAVEAELGATFSAAMSAQIATGWAERTCLALDRFALALAGAPDLARLVFVATLDAAPTSLQWRDGLVAEWADALYEGAPAGSRPSPEVAESTVAAIWGYLADVTAAHRLDLLPSQTARLAFFALVPVLGARETLETIRGIPDLDADI